MGIDMYVGASQSQASSALAKSQSDGQSYQTMIQALQQFINEGQLNSTAYSNGKSFYNAILIPLVKAGILLSEAVGEACQKFTQDYQSMVDSGDLKSDELREKISQLNVQISHLDSIRATIESKDLADNFKLRQLNQNSRMRETLDDTKTVLQEKLDKLFDFHAKSPDIFSNISELESIIDKGASQADSSWTGNSFSIPTDLDWTTTVAGKWQTRTDNLKKKEKEFHEAKIKELEKHNVYALPYQDPITKEVKILWFIDKNGVRVFDDELQNYVEKYGKNLEGIYEVVSWEKIYELDIAARQRGDGKNYLNDNQLPESWQDFGRHGANWDSFIWSAQKSGLFDLAMMAGLTYMESKTKVSTSSNVANVMNDIDDISRTKTPEQVIADRTQAFDLNSYPQKYPQLSAKKMKELKTKVNNRTITQAEYKQYTWNQDINSKRKLAVKDFWNQERIRVLQSNPTREWLPEQTTDILKGNTAKYNGKALQGHHTYSVSKHPHLADAHEIIYPATFDEHFYGWHDGNWKNSIPGQMINPLKDF